DNPPPRGPKDYFGFYDSSLELDKATHRVAGWDASIEDGASPSYPLTTAYMQTFPFLAVARMAEAVNQKNRTGLTPESLNNPGLNRFQTNSRVAPVVLPNRRVVWTRLILGPRYTFFPSYSDADYYESLVD
ncbi:MAG: hypothetical protein FJZ01_28475, partial [Candidatus Sericytochromatia bacterium]|nr:hypothetical protein [Candidatus Tanganyikabacteria bacterium]